MGCLIPYYGLQEADRDGLIFWNDIDQPCIADSVNGEMMEHYSAFLGIEH